MVESGAPVTCDLVSHYLSQPSFSSSRGPWIWPAERICDVLLAGNAYDHESRLVRASATPRYGQRIINSIQCAMIRGHTPNIVSRSLLEYLA